MKHTHPLWGKTGPIIAEEVARQTELSSFTKILYGCITAKCYEQGVFRLNQSEIARHMHVSRHTVLRSLRKLSECGLVHTVGTGKPRTYVATHIPDPHEIMPDGPDSVAA